MARFFGMTRAAFGPPFFSGRGRLAFWMVCVLLAAAVPSPAETLTGRAAFVADGDTFHLETGEKIRLLGLDAPEIAHEGRPAQFGADEARRALAKMVRDLPLRLEIPGGLRDRHGRLLALVFTPDGTCLNEALLAAGLAFFSWHEDLPPDLPGRLLPIQRRAMAAGAGFWPGLGKLPPGPYVGNRRTLRFHSPDCVNGRKIAPANRVAFPTALEAFAAGFCPARPCTPWPTIRAP